MESQALIPIERTLRCLEGGVNRQSAAQKHLKTCQMQTQPEYSGYKPGYSRFCVRSIRSYIHSLRVWNNVNENYRNQCMKSRSSYRTRTRGSLRLISNKQNSLETRIRVDGAQTLEMRSHKQMAIEQVIQQQRDRDLFPEVHTRSCYVSVEEWFKRWCSRTPIFLSQGWDHLSSAMSLTMYSSARNEAYKLLVQLTILIEQSQARLAV